MGLKNIFQIIFLELYQNIIHSIFSNLYPEDVLPWAPPNDGRIQQIDDGRQINIFKTRAR
ncbi:MAG: hypothetical protein DLM72_15625 [Candidatus Nitrosopolaris wilkensis]|nr:MAG: hypothetical protein DLM72_15625 [Candidatus Nitrosopolaris wilkensis]